MSQNRTGSIDTFLAVGFGVRVWIGPDRRWKEHAIRAIERRFLMRPKSDRLPLVSRYLWIHHRKVAVQLTVAKADLVYRHCEAAQIDDVDHPSLRITRLVQPSSVFIPDACRVPNRLNIKGELRNHS